jgi:hypothetical protein
LLKITIPANQFDTEKNRFAGIVIFKDLNINVPHEIHKIPPGHPGLIHVYYRYMAYHSYQ